MKAEPQRYADGNVGIAGEIGIDLQGVAEERHHVFKTRVAAWIGKYPIHKIHCDVIGEEELL